MAVDITKSTYRFWLHLMMRLQYQNYIPSASKSDQYQSEADLEDETTGL